MGLFAQQPTEVFAGCTVAFARDVAIRDKSSLTATIRQHGGQVSSFVGSQCTHLIAAKPDSKATSSSFNGWIVPPSYFVDSAARGVMLPEEGYAFSAPRARTAATNSTSDTRSRAAESLHDHDEPDEPDELLSGFDLFTSDDGSKLASSAGDNLFGSNDFAAYLESRRSTYRFGTDNAAASNDWQPSSDNIMEVDDSEVDMLSALLWGTDADTNLSPRESVGSLSSSNSNSNDDRERPRSTVVLGELKKQREEERLARNRARLAKQQEEADRRRQEKELEAEARRLKTEARKREEEEKRLRLAEERKQRVNEVLSTTGLAKRAAEVEATSSNDDTSDNIRHTRSKLSNRSSATALDRLPASPEPVDRIQELCARAAAAAASAYNNNANANHSATTAVAVHSLVQDSVITPATAVTASSSASGSSSDLSNLIELLAPTPEEETHYLLRIHRMQQQVEGSSASSSATGTTKDKNKSKSKGTGGEVANLLAQWQRQEAADEHRRRRQEKAQREKDAIERRKQRKLEVEIAKERNRQEERAKAEERRAAKHAQEREAKSQKHLEWLKRQEEWEIEQRRRKFEWAKHKEWLEEQRNEKRQAFLSNREQILLEERTTAGRKIFVSKVTFDDIDADASLSLERRAQAREKRCELVLSILKEYGTIANTKPSWDKGYVFVTYELEASATAAIKELCDFQVRERLCAAAGQRLYLQGFEASIAPKPTFYVRWPKRSAETNPALVQPTAPRMQRAPKEPKPVVEPTPEEREREKQKRKLRKANEKERKRKEAERTRLLAKFTATTPAAAPGTTTTTTTATGTPSAGRGRGGGRGGSSIGTAAPQSSMATRGRGGARGGRGGSRGRGGEHSFASSAEW